MKFRPQWKMRPSEIDSKRASDYFWSGLFIWGAIWLVLPWMIEKSPNLFDTLETQVVGREWVMGTAKHPPLPFWILEICYQATGRSLISVYLAAISVIMLGLWSVWRLARHYFSESLALVVVLATAAYRFFNMGSLGFTTNIPPVAFWTCAIFLFFRALKANRLRDWFLTGLVLGAGFLCKYSFGILAVTMVFYLVYSRFARRYWRTPGPYVATLTAFLVFLPHFIWVVQNDFPTFQYASESLAEGTKPWTAHLIAPLSFLGSQFFLILPPIIPLAALLGFFWQLRFKKDAERDFFPPAADVPEDSAPSQAILPTPWRHQFLTIMIFFPVLLHLAIAAATGTSMRTSYGAPLWTLVVLWFVDTFEIRPRGGDKAAKTTSFKRTSILAAAVLAATVFAYWADYHFRYYFESAPAKIHYPGKTIGKIVELKWKNRFPLQACPYLSGDWVAAGAAAANMADRPSVLCYYYGLEPGKKPVGLWATDADMNREGGIVLWTLEEFPKGAPPYLAERYPTAEIAPEIMTIPYLTPAKIPPLHLRYAIIPPVQ